MYIWDRSKYLIYFSLWQSPYYNFEETKFILVNRLTFTFGQVEDNFVLESEKEKFVEELRAIVGQAQEILHVHSAAERAIGVDSITMESSSSQVREIAQQIGLLGYVSGTSLFIYSFLIQTGSSEQVQINSASTQTSSKYT